LALSAAVSSVHEFVCICACASRLPHSPGFSTPGQAVLSTERIKPPPLLLLPLLLLLVLLLLLLQGLGPPIEPKWPQGGLGWHIWDVNLGDVIDIYIHNKDDGEHPIHLHGHRELVQTVRNCSRLSHLTSMHCTMPVIVKQGRVR
jgi:hypothetical protein